MEIAQLLKENPEIKLIRGKITLHFKDGFFIVENTGKTKNRSITQSISFESALQAFLQEGK